MARRFRATVRVTYLGGTLVAGDRSALARALGDNCTFTVSPEVFDVITVTAEVDGGTALEALASLERRIDRALHYIGLMEHFDISGKSLTVQPCL